MDAMESSPRERRREANSEPSTPVKLSRPQKRRRRLQVLAAARATEFIKPPEPKPEANVDIARKLDLILSLLQPQSLQDKWFHFNAEAPPFWPSAYWEPLPEKGDTDKNELAENCQPFAMTPPADPEKPKVSFKDEPEIILLDPDCPFNGAEATSGAAVETVQAQADADEQRLEELRDCFCENCQTWGPKCECGNPEMEMMQDCGVVACAGCYSTRSQETIAACSGSRKKGDSHVNKYLNVPDLFHTSCMRPLEHETGCEYEDDDIYICRGCEQRGNEAECAGCKPRCRQPG